MTERRKRIGVFMAQPESFYQRQLMEGITSEAFSFNMDVLVFASFLKKGGLDVFQVGEKNIFTLPNMDLLDAVIVVPDVIQLEGSFEYIEENLLANFNKPVVYIDSKSDKYFNICCDEDRDIDLLITHLVKVHNCKRIAFMTGYEYHPHAINRLNSFKKSMAGLKLEVDDSLIFYGDFWYGKGEEVAEKLVALDKLPDAIACGSDTMALSVLRALEARGVKVPEDIIVTGYDADGDGIDQRHFVTSVPKSNKATAVNAVRYIYNKLCGINIEFEPVKHSKLITTHSCGCSKSKESIKNQGMFICGCAYDNNDGFYSGYNFMLENTIGAVDLTDCLWKIDWYTLYLDNFDDFYICLCDGWNNPHTAYNGYLKTGYTDKMYLVYDHSKPHEEAVDLDRTFPVSEMLPDIDKERDHPSVFYFLPMHFNNRCFGYSVLLLGNKEQELCQTLSQWMRNINTSLESLRRQTNLIYMYQKMEDSAVMDLPTGLFNRNGFNIYSQQMLEKAISEDNEFLLVIGDLNCLKYINDAYGHTAGDSAIVKVAQAFLETANGNTESRRCFRIGGDEFVKILVGQYGNEQDIEYEMQCIRDYLDEYNKNSNLDYPVQVSLGVFSRKLTEKDTIDSILTEADKKMFADKQRIKQATGFDHKR